LGVLQKKGVVVKCFDQFSKNLISLNDSRHTRVGEIFSPTRSTYTSYFSREHVVLTGRT